MSSRAGRCNSNERGSSYDRRRRRAWLVSVEAGFGGDGEKVACWECGVMLTVVTLVVDRIVPGERGGRYRRDNIRPHCTVCSCRQGARRTNEIAQERSNYTDADLCKECGAHYLGTHAAGCQVAVSEHEAGW